jgi:predicted HTH domain antitoxin
MAAHTSEPELRQEHALTLFQQERLTLTQATHFAEMSQLAFQALLAECQIPIHYGLEEFREDLRTLRPVGIGLIVVSDTPRRNGWADRARQAGAR